jgi:hypothetical protein
MVNDEWGVGPLSPFGGRQKTWEFYPPPALRATSSKGGQKL